MAADHGLREPTRLLDDPSAPAELRALLRSARPTSGPTSRDAAALRARVDAVAGSPAAPTASVGPWVGLGVLAVVGLGLVVARPGGNAAPSAAAERAPLSATSPATTPQAEPARALAPPPPAGRQIQRATEAEPTVAEAAPTPRPRATRPSRGLDSLAAEQALLEHARASLGPDPRRALSLLERHALGFPDGQLAAEREFLAVQALNALGRVEDARARRGRFLARYPGSPYAPLLRDGGR